MQLKALRMVLELEQGREDEYAREFAQARSQLNLSERRLAGLTSYRMDYLRQANERAKTGIGSANFGHYHAFVGKLDTGIVQQQERLQKTQAQVAQIKSRWLSQQQRRKAIENLIEQRQAELEKKKARQEQLTSDEFAMQGFLRRKNTKR